PPPVEEPAGGDDRHPVTDGVDHLRHESHGGDGPGVTTRLGALGDNEIAAALDGRHGVAHLAGHGAHEDVALGQDVDGVARHARAGHEHASAALDHVG